MTPAKSNVESGINLSTIGCQADLSFGGGSRFVCIDCQYNLRTQAGNGPDGPGLNRKIAGIRLRACLNANAEATNGRCVPQRSLWFGQTLDETTESPYSGIRSLGVFGDFKVRRIFSAVLSYVEGSHLPTQALHQGLKITLRVDIQINVQKVCGWQNDLIVNERGCSPPVSAPVSTEPLSQALPRFGTLRAMLTACFHHKPW